MASNDQNTGNKKPATTTNRTPDKVVTAATKANVVETPAEEVVDTTVTPVDTASEGDSENLTELKRLLAAFKDAASAPGDTIGGDRVAANLVSQITQHIIKFPKLDLLEEFLSFVKTNIDGVASPAVFMKGCDTLASLAQRQVGMLYGLFGDLAHENVVSVSSGVVTSVLNKPEIIGFYNRRMAYIKQQAKAASLAQ